MSPVIWIGGCTPEHPFPAWFRDADVLCAIYNEINRLCVKGGRTKAKRAEMQEKLVPFGRFVSCQIAPFPSNIRVPQSAIYFGLSHRSHTDTGSHVEWTCRMYYDYTICTGISSWKVYDDSPLVVPARVKWNAVIKRVAAMTKVVNLWRKVAAEPDSLAVQKAAKRFKAGSTGVYIERVH